MIKVNDKNSLEKDYIHISYKYLYFNSLINSFKYFTLGNVCMMGSYCFY